MTRKGRPKGTPSQRNPANLVLPLEKEEVAKIIATNLHKALTQYKMKKGFITDTVGRSKGDSQRCPCCDQLLPNPYTQEWLAIQCGMSKPTIVNFFQGNRLPTILILLSIANVLEISINNLLEGLPLTAMQ